MKSRTSFRLVLSGLAVLLVALWIIPVLLHQLSPEARLGLKYEPPTVPEEVPARYVPPPHTKPELPPGQTHFDLKARYRSSHRYGWDEAIFDWTHHQQFRLHIKQDAYSHHADWECGYDAFWLGYTAAREQIERMKE